MSAAGARESPHARNLPKHCMKNNFSAIKKTSLICSSHFAVLILPQQFCWNRSARFGILVAEWLRSSLTSMEDLCMAKTIKKANTSAKAAAKPRKPAAAKTTNGKVQPISISREKVAQLAHRFWTERGQQHGHHEEDWYRAEQALRGKAS
jgi:hypothetical protein